MKELQRKQRMKQLVYSWPALVLAAIVTFFIIKGAVGIMIIERGSANRVTNLEKEAEALALRESELKSEIAKLRTDDGIVEEIKEKFSVTRDGEHVAIIVNERNGATTTENSIIWYKKLWNAMIGK